VLSTLCLNWIGQNGLYPLDKLGIWPIIYIGRNYPKKEDGDGTVRIVH